MLLSSHTLSGADSAPGSTSRGSSHLVHTLLSTAAVAVLSCALVACGGGGGGGGTTGAEAPASGGNTLLSAGAGATPTNDADVYRFLTQASFGPSAEDVARVKAIGYDAWIDEQFGLHLQSTHAQMTTASALVLGEDRPTPQDITYSWWTHAIKDPAQLRQRVAFALSEIFVVSTQVLDNGRTVASYMDMLTDKADGNFRDLLEAVALHPAMGQYLSHMSNRKEDPATGRVPDENFAREIMQLFSIGLYELDDSGNPLLDSNGKPQETYTADDIKGLAKVFTGYSWNWPVAKAALTWWTCFWRGAECNTPEQDVVNMSAYSAEHSTSAKQFLGVTVAAQSTANPAASVRAALDRLASHRNTAPFISKQLIQRLVTSNPSNAYVRDITQVFRASNGNLRTVVKAILLHSEARQPDLSNPNYGKLREPVLRLTHLLRVLPHTSTSYAAGLAANKLPFYRINDTSDPSTGIGQTPMRAPSVFNFFRPGYTPPQSRLSNASLVSPEMQIINESSALFYANTVSQFLHMGGGEWDSVGNTGFDIHFNLGEWNDLVNAPADLVDAVSRKLLGQTLPTDARTEAVAAITAMSATNDNERWARIAAAVWLTSISPSFIVQQ